MNTVLKWFKQYRKWVIIGGVAMLVILALAFGALLLPSSRGNYAGFMSEANIAFDAPAAAPPMVEVGRSASGGSASDGLSLVDNVPQQSEQQSQERVILRDATMQIVVEDTKDTLQQISTMADEMGGWVVNANNSSYTTNNVNVTNGNIKVRVPADRLNEALDRIRNNAIEVKSENVNGRDVTEDYIDQSSRLRNLKLTEEQLALILEDARTVEDVLAVQTELTRIRTDIEVIEGRLRFYDQSAAFSSIDVTVQEKVPSVGTVEVRGWNPLQTAENAFGMLIIVGRTFVDTAIFLVVVGVPALLVLTIIVWIIRRVWRSRRRAEKTLS